MPHSLSFTVTVAFTVQAEPIDLWSPQACALSFVRHRIDEGLPLHDHIKNWYFLNVSSPK